MPGKAMRCSYIVVVKGNLVCAIEPASASADGQSAGTPLEIASALAINFGRSGCIDGHYAFGDAVAARAFALLCLRFSKALVERRLAAINGLPSDHPAYLADEQPAGDRAG